MSLLSEKEAKRLTDRVLKAATYPEVQVRVGAEAESLTRYANNEITQNVANRDVSVAVTVARQGRKGSASTNDLSSEGLKQVVAQAETVAGHAPVDPEYLPPVGPQTYPVVPAHFPRTAAFTPADRAALAREICTTAEKAGVAAAGTVSNGERATAVAASSGLFAYFTSTACGASTTARTPDGTGSGRASVGGVRDVARLEAVALGRRAIQKAVASRQPKELTPGDYTVVLEPEAVASLLAFMMFNLGARDAEEGRSFFSGATKGATKLGQRVVGENITIRSDPTHPELLGRPFQNNGLPAPRLTWIEKGVLKHLTYDRFWAKEKGKEATGFPSSTLMEGGKAASVEALIASTKRGVYVTRFWYNRSVNPMQIITTGLTRDGTFLIEDGKLAHPIVNFRYNESPIVLLQNVTAMTAPTLTSFWQGTTLLPAVKADNFTFTSISPAV